MVIDRFCRIKTLIWYNFLFFNERDMISFKWRRFPKDIILMSVRWKLAYALSYRDIEEMMEERGICVDHSSVQRWVVHYSPQLESKFRKYK